jgi:hypothetical protein
MEFDEVGVVVADPETSQSTRGNSDDTSGVKRRVVMNT